MWLAGLTLPCFTLALPDLAFLCCLLYDFFYFIFSIPSPAAMRCASWAGGLSVLPTCTHGRSGMDEWGWDSQAQGPDRLLTSSAEFEIGPGRSERASKRGKEKKKLPTRLHHHHPQKSKKKRHFLLYSGMLGPHQKTKQASNCADERLKRSASPQL